MTQLYQRIRIVTKEIRLVQQEAKTKLEEAFVHYVKLYYNRVLVNLRYKSFILFVLYWVSKYLRWVTMWQGFSGHMNFRRNFTGYKHLPTMECEKL